MERQLVMEPVWNEVLCPTHQFVMMYWVRTVPDSIISLFGVTFITDVSKSRTMRSTVQTLNVFVISIVCLLKILKRHMERHLTCVSNG